MTAREIMKVLIVDDNKKVREMLGMWLHDLVDEICECADGAEALEAYTSFLPDLVLMDWEMKRMDGITATQQIVSNFPKARIVMITMHNRKELRTTAIKAGVCDFILKENLMDLRRCLIDNREQRV